MAATLQGHPRLLCTRAEPLTPTPGTVQPGQGREVQTLCPLPGRDRCCFHSPRSQLWLRNREPRRAGPICSLSSVAIAVTEWVCGNLTSQPTDGHLGGFDSTTVCVYPPFPSDFSSPSCLCAGLLVRGFPQHPPWNLVSEGRGAKPLDVTC